MGTMSRIHRRAPGGDWSLEVRRDYTDVTPLGSAMLWVYAPPVYLLSMTLAPDEARQLMDEVLREAGGVAYVYRGSPTLEQFANGALHVRDIEVTADEAQRILHDEDPREVLGLTAPACGYRLRAVLDPLVGGTT